MQGEMLAVVTTGTGSYDKLVFKRVPMPVPGPGEVLLKVLAAGVNNTEINTRLGWYSASVTEGTDVTGSEEERPDGGWNAATPFPFIQGTDCCGEVVEVGVGGDALLLERRVLVRACMRQHGFERMENIWMGSDFDGAFAQFVKVPEAEVFPVDCDWTDAELATIPCAYGTAENMVHRAGVGAGMRVLVPGASGGVGSALVQLVKRRGAEVIAITSAEKRDAVAGIGADRVLTREDDLLEALGAESVDVVIDNVAGAGFPTMLKLLRRGGRYASSGAIAGPMVALDMRDMYLKDITLIGCTAWDEPVFRNLVAYIERGEIRPLLAGTYPLDRIADAQRDFQTKRHIGKLVLLPPA
ncbi:alcohol dehydrogenase family protein [Marimonas sp. MJW-29]|uniref:Alcohol dehydrogenase family protein n=1 Tax=Sulfitobacter sediminis TaxID=3234186 RepID=A0ABV3RGN4_9RHOB